jgi:hypothetical protein
MVGPAQNRKDQKAWQILSEIFAQPGVSLAITRPREFGHFHCEK